MAIGNIVTSRAKDYLTKKMGVAAPILNPVLDKQLGKAGAAIDAPLNSVISSIPGLGGVVGSSSFSDPQSQASAIAKAYTTSGLIAADGTAIPPSYLVSIISSKLNHMIVAPLQDKTSFHVTSEWEPFIPTTGLDGVVNQISQLVFKQALISRFTTRRIWKGTSPIDITLQLYFNSVNDTYKNVIEPIMRLLQMAAPSTGGTLSKYLPLLTPPGPSPYAVDTDTGALNQGLDALGGAGQSVKEWLKDGDNIEVSIGSYLKFEKVIVKDVAPVFDTKHDVSGWPISASATVTFQTYEIQTKDSIENQIFKLKKGS